MGVIGPDRLVKGVVCLPLVGCWEFSLKRLLVFPPVGDWKVVLTLQQLEAMGPRVDRPK